MIDMGQIKTSKPFRGVVDSRIGGRSENQDFCGYADTKLGLLVTVCDGMGGGPGGKTASHIAVQEIIAGVAEADGTEDSANVLIKSIRRANMAIIARGDEEPELKGMGSTATVLLINSHSALVAHVGDSRVYQLRNRAKIFRTFDHSMVFELVRQKVITEEQARLSEQSNVITRALGIKPDVEVDVCELAYEKGDRFLLCTDGVHGTMPEKELIGIVTDTRRPLAGVMENLVTKVDTYGLQKGGGHDNLTAALVETTSNSILKEKMSKRIKNMLVCLLAVLVVSLLGNSVLVYQKMSGAKQATASLAANGDSACIAQNKELQDSMDHITLRFVNYKKEMEKEVDECVNIISDKDSINAENTKKLRDIIGKLKTLKQ